MDILVSNEKTPNPESMKFKVNRSISTSSASFKSIMDSESSPLATKLFGFPWAKSIHIGEDFITITKQEWVGWDILVDPLCELIKEHIETRQPVLIKIEKKSEDTSEDSEDVQFIKEFLNAEVRPFVAMDGGDIQFEAYKEGVLYLHMQGACSGCPSSSVTLKNGIEVKLKERLPGFITVQAI